MSKINFDVIIGKNIVDINRVCNMLCIEFQSPKGVCVSLHVQSFFRVSQRNKILISSEDMFRCNDEREINDFQWDVPGKSVFDKSIVDYHDLLFNSLVTKVEQNEIGDCFIFFNNDLVFQIFIDTTETEEKYRLFDTFDSLEVYS